MEGLLSGIVGAIIGFVGSVLALRFSYKNLFAKTVSSERILWLKDMRKFVDELIWYLKSNEDKKDIAKYTSPIILRLNTKKDKDLIKKLKKLEDDPNSEKADDLRADFSQMFKYEWEKVKCEARGFNNYIKYYKGNRWSIFLHYLITTSVYVVIMVFIGILLFNCDILDNLSESSYIDNANSLIYFIKAIFIICNVLIPIVFSVSIIINVANKDDKEEDENTDKEKQKKIQQMKTKQNKKTLSKNQKIVIAIVVISVFLIAGCAVNIGLACKSGDKANIFTAISGWIGFLATAGIGIITLQQNVKYKQMSQMQYHIDKLCRARDVIYSNCKQFSNCGYITDTLVVMHKTSGNPNGFYEIIRKLSALNNLCETQIQDLYNLRYNFKKVLPLFEIIYKIRSMSLELIRKHQINSDYYECGKLYENAQQIYFELLIEIDNKISELMEKDISYKDFVNKIMELEDIKDKTNKMMSFLEGNIKKETQNGQAEDDVNGQDK